MAASRERFLTDESPEPRTVRDTILASWRRSHDLRVAADKIDMPFEADAHLDTRLSRSAEPVLRSLQEQLQGQSVSVILTDPAGLVLSRLTGDGEFDRHLDRVRLAPGFSYAEKFVGTNGIGTALEVGGPAHVFGHEHYAENLENLACAGVPIHHPISGRLVGAVDLTCWRKDAGPLLLTLAKTTAEQIRQALLADAGASQLGLFQEYLRTCSRRTGVVFALNSDVVMLNDHARAVLEPDDQAALLAQATEALVPGHRGKVLVELPSGQTARMYFRTVGSADMAPGIVAHVKLDPSPQPPLSQRGRASLDVSARTRRLQPTVASRLPGGGAGLPIERLARAWRERLESASWPCCARSSSAASPSGGSCSSRRGTHAHRPPLVVVCPRCGARRR